MELLATDILRSLNFLLKCDIFNDAFTWSCRLVVAEIEILHFGYSFCLYAFSLRTLPNISLDVLSKALFVPMCKMMWSGNFWGGGFI